MVLIMNTLIARIIPFIFLGIALVALVFGLILLAYLFIAGAFVGLVLFAIAWIRDTYFSSKSLSKPNNTKRQGRTIEHEDRK